MRKLTIAWWCGAVPLTLGTFEFLAWLVTRMDIWVMLGILTIAGGLIVVGAGLVFLTMHVVLDEAPRGERRGVWMVLGLLLINFPAAALYAYTADTINSRYVVIVSNLSSQPIDSFFVESSSFRQELGPIPPGTNRSTTFRITGDDSIWAWTARDGASECVGLENYVTNGQGGRTIVTFKTDHSITIQRRGRDGSHSSQPCSF